MIPIDELIDLHEKTIKKSVLKKTLAELSERKEAYERDLHYFKSDLSREESDVENLEKASAKNIFLKITGQMEKKRKKENDEVYSAKEKYDSILVEYDSFKKEYNSVLKEFRFLGNCDLDYNELKKQIFTELRSDLTTDSNIIAQISLLEQAQSELEERRIVIDTVNDLIIDAEQILEDFEPIRQLASADLRSPDNFYGKYSRLESLLPRIESLDRRLRKLSKEAADFPTICIHTSLKYDKLTKGLDNLLGSYTIERAVLQDIVNAISEINTAQQRLSFALGNLTNIYSEKKKRCADFETELLQAIKNNLA